MGIVKAPEGPRASKIWFNGKLVPWDDAQLHVLTHSLHYSGAVFEGIRAYAAEQGPAVFRLKEHVDRLARSAKLYYMDLPYSPKELADAVVETVRANKLRSCYIRPIAYRARGPMGVPALRNPVHVAIAVWEWGAYLGADSEKGIKCIVSSWRRTSHRSLPMHAKATGNYQNSMLAHYEAERAGAAEAILLNEFDHVAEGSGENLFIVQGRKVITPPIESGILPGITRDSILKLAKDAGHEVEERTILRDELYTADEAFMTGTATEVAPVIEIDGQKVGAGRPGSVALHLRQKYLETVHGKHPEYRHWLTYVK
jgi:branched-chain amino acid aminotransferase